MQWFRTNRAFGAKLALIALALQLVLSFGHTHGAIAKSGLLSDVSQIEDACQLAPAKSAISLASAKTCAASDRTDGSSDHGALDLCAVCAVLAQLAASYHSDAPVLLAPDASQFSLVSANTEFFVFDISRTAFQPRAPPAA